MSEEYELANQHYLNALAQGACLKEADEVFLAVLKIRSQPQEKRVPGDITERIPDEIAPVEEVEEPEWPESYGDYALYMSSRDLAVDARG